MKTHNHNARGVTLVEIAIVLVIIGLLLGGILKGQELINNARVKNMVGYQESLRGAWYSFIDRYEAIPGDWTRAEQFLAVNENAVVNGDGNGYINELESPLVFTHLVAAGFIRCPVCDDGLAGNPNADEFQDDDNGLVPNPENSPTNNFGGIVAIFHDVGYWHGRNNDRLRGQLMAHSGPRVPSNLARDVDNKIDDGFANAGDVRMNNFDPAGSTDGDQQSDSRTAGGMELGTDDVDSCVGTGDGNTGDVGDIETAVAIDNGNLSTPQYPWRLATATGGPTHANCGFSVRL